MYDEVWKEVGIMQHTLDRLEAHLSKRIDGLGSLDTDLVRTRLAEMRVNLDKMKEKSATVAPSIATNA